MLPVFVSEIFYRNASHFLTELYFSYPAVFRGQFGTIFLGALNFCERTFAAAWAQHFVVQLLVSTVSALGFFRGWVWVSAASFSFCLSPSFSFFWGRPGRPSSGLRRCNSGLSDSRTFTLARCNCVALCLFFPSLLPGSAPSSLALSLSLSFSLPLASESERARLTGETLA